MMSSVFVSAPRCTFAQVNRNLLVMFGCKDDKRLAANQVCELGRLASVIATFMTSPLLFQVTTDRCSTPWRTGRVRTRPWPQSKSCQWWVRRQTSPTTKKRPMPPTRTRPLTPLLPVSRWTRLSLGTVKFFFRFLRDTTFFLSSVVMDIDTVGAGRECGAKLVTHTDLSYYMVANSCTLGCTSVG